MNQCSHPVLNDCDINADCIDEAYGYTCICKEGFEGDGKKCSSKTMIFGL